jgi:hypothetical protein
MRTRTVPFGWLLGALAAGLAVAWLDSRPTWNDTGITAGLLFAGSALLGLARPGAAWWLALAIGLPLPITELGLRPGAPNAGSLLAVAVALLGATGGALARRSLAGSAL